MPPMLKFINKPKENARTNYIYRGGALTSGDWVAVSLAYIGLQGAADIAATWKHGRGNG